ncbi:hypothetical protein [Flavihumibacter sp. CACIAM 22H1]|uniref:hypothetical protein n=1 Tax=Flavihumibacter sp. CACIAM 22H1 TaxID=1812911 RepID=UPI0007A7C3C6|nr:hypothetical protein [Flavihumibacter sp. CACIAM 22H1]KYP13033.1 MAG: hypothetical protein A1D16_04835 [Flavihumibacter sp. CACIAM 22H1]
MNNIKEYLTKHYKTILILVVAIAFVIIVAVIISNAIKNNKPDVVKYAGYKLDKDGNLIYTGEITYDPVTLSAAIYEDMKGHNLLNWGRRNMTAYGEWLALKEAEFIGLYNYYNAKYAKTHDDNLLYRLSQEKEWTAPPVLGSDIFRFLGFPSLDDMVGARGFSIVRQAILDKADNLEIPYKKIKN